jgi:glycosyltransferase involved in cell wall biosynthesis
MKISYGITVCDEYEELDHLLYSMHPLLEDSDEIIILRDISKTNSKVTKVIESHRDIYKNQLIVVEARLNNDFATFKNQLLTWATGDYLFQIDADETPNPILIGNLKSILEANKEIDCYYIPRINVVWGLTQDHIQKWGWKISKLENHTSEDILDLDNPKDRDRYELYKKYNLIIEESKLS